jgi:plastocyanin
MKKKRPYRKTLFGIISFLFLACGKDESNLVESVNGSARDASVTTTGAGTTNYAARVSIQSSSYSPADLTVMASGTVLWNNIDGNVHTVTADNGAFDSGDIQPGASFTHTFETAGPYTYYCKYHREQTAIVKAVHK